MPRQAYSEELEAEGIVKSGCRAEKSPREDHEAGEVDYDDDEFEPLLESEMQVFYSSLHSFQ